MAAEVNLKRSKILYKIEILILKYIPFVVAFIYFLNTVLSMCNINASILSYIAGVSLLPWIFLLLSSFVFKFCNYHRIPLYYILVNDIVNITDEYFQLPISNLLFIAIHSVIFFIGFVTIFVLRKKCNHDNNIKEISIENSK